MASWMIHLRVADKLLSSFELLDLTAFVVGNIAPDSGLPNGDGTYTPNKDQSHFRTDSESEHPRPDPALFVSLYLTPTQLARYTVKERSFYLGYYAHLLTDVAWLDDIFVPCMKQHMEESTADLLGFINGPLKRDWYDLDYLYLRDHPDFRAWKIFKAANNFKNTYIDLFAPYAFADRQQFIVRFYLQEKENLDRVYPYLTKEHAEEFTEQTATKIAEELTAITENKCYCGHDCSKCVTYIATQTDDDFLRERSQRFYQELIGRKIPLEQFNCQGGQSDEIFEPCLECPFRKCCMKRDYKSCEECPGYPCTMLADYRSRHGDKNHQILIHSMNLVPSAFQKIANGTKTIELRLNDLKRRAIAVGDHIVFGNTETDECVEVVVRARHEFASFEELYAALPLTKCGYLEEELTAASPTDMHAYYNDEQIALHGVVGLEVVCI